MTICCGRQQLYVLTAEDSSQHETVKAGCAGESDKNNFRICLLNYIIENAGFCITTYCLIRHLIKYDEKILESFIETLSSRLNLSVERYHYLACYILLLEGCYKKAYLHLEFVTMEEYLKSFIPELGSDIKSLIPELSKIKASSKDSVQKARSHWNGIAKPLHGL